MKKFIIIFFIFLLSTIVYAQDDRTLTIAWPVNAGPLNPHLYNPNQMYAQIMVYDSLVRYTPDGIKAALKLLHIYILASVPSSIHFFQIYHTHQVLFQ